MGSPRRSRNKKRDFLQLLPRAVYRYYLRHPNPAKDFVLFFQPHCAVCFNRVDGTAGFHTATGLGREALSR